MAERHIGLISGTGAGYGIEPSLCTTEEVMS